MTQAGLLEHLKLENVSLSQQLTETQHRSIKEKERIAVQLQSIEVRTMTVVGAGFYLALGSLAGVRKHSILTLKHKACR